MYGIPTLSNVLKPTQNTIQIPTTQPSQNGQQKPAQSFTTPQELNGKRPRTALGDTSSKDQEESPVHKVVKTESEERSETITQKSNTENQEPQTKNQDMNQLSQPNLNLAPGGDKNLLNNFIINNLMLPNPQGGITSKPQDNPLQKMSNPNLLLSLLQNPPGGFGLPNQLTPKPSQGPGLGGLGSLGSFPGIFPPNLPGKTGPLAGLGLDGNFGIPQDSSPTNVGAVANLINDIKMKTESGLTGDGFLKEFQGRILGLLFTQNKMLLDLKEKNDALQDTLACLINEINTIKNTAKPVGKEKSTTSGGNVNPHQFLAGNTETVSVEDLVTFLYGPSPDFQYQLILKSDLPLPLYRERNFKFTVVLTDKNGNAVENSNRIPLTIGLYSSENPPKYIDANTSGNKILKGFIEKELVNGSATFEKIQIKEVTSHFRNGWIFFVVYPKISNTNPNPISVSSNVIASQKIKPLILEKVVVKAKKAKEKEQADANEGEDNPSIHAEEKEGDEGKGSKAEE